jgi:hypothetical protein
MDPELHVKLAWEFGLRPEVVTVPFIKVGGGGQDETKDASEVCMNDVIRYY